MNIPSQESSVGQQEQSHEQVTTPLHPRGEWVSEVKDGDTIHTHFNTRNEGVFNLILDFESFKDELNGIDKETLSSNYKKNEAKVKSLLDERKADVDGYVFWACFEINQRVNRVLNQQENFGRLAQIEQERDELFRANPGGVKLSELKHHALCSETAALAKFCLQEAGIKSALVSGDKMEDEETFDFGAHTYLIINPNQENCLVFDVNNPDLVSMGNDKVLFPRLLKPVVPLSREILDQPQSKTGSLVRCKGVLFGEELYFGVSQDGNLLQESDKPTLIKSPQDLDL